MGNKKEFVKLTDLPMEKKLQTIINERYNGSFRIEKGGINQFRYDQRNKTSYRKKITLEEFTTLLGKVDGAT